MFIDEIKDEILRLNLINYAKKSAEDYFFQWRSESENEQTKYLGQDINVDDLESYLKLVKYGVQVNADRENSVWYQIVFDITTLDGEQRCIYYSYFDISGNLVDNFVDK